MSPEFNNEAIREQYQAVLRELLEQRIAMVGETAAESHDPNASVEQQLESLTLHAEQMRQQQGGKTNEFIIMQGASGAGKSTIGKALGLPRFPRHTDRQPRPGEVDGADYIFISADEFTAKLEAGDFVGNPAETYGERRGMDRRTLDSFLAKGGFYIDGSARTPLDFYSDPEYHHHEFLSVFVMPPSFDELVRRLHARTQQERGRAQTDLQVSSEDQIQKRIAGSVEHLRKALASQDGKPVTDLFLVNDHIERATGIVRSVIGSNKR